MFIIFRCDDGIDMKRRYEVFGRLKIRNSGFGVFFKTPFRYKKRISKVLSKQDWKSKEEK